MAEENRYIKVEIEMDTIYLKEQVYGITTDSVKLNNITKATYVNFYHFFEDKYRLYPIIIKNDNKHLTILKSLLQGSGVIKAEIEKLPNDHIKINMTRYIENKALLISDNSRIIPDVTLLFKNI